MPEGHLDRGIRKLLNAAFGNTGAPLHQLARRYGVRYVIAGHVHQMLHTDLEGVSYVSMASAGAHLRLSGQYDAGWFFGHALVEVGRVVFGVASSLTAVGRGPMISA